METADELLANTPRHFTAASSDRLLYVGQGEAAYATSQQCDVIASDKATTCHILAFRSSSEKGPMVSLTHIDAAGYESCIRNMITKHVVFHSDGEEKKSECGSGLVNIDVYVMGGFEDHDDSSRAIANFMMRLLVDVAAEQSQVLTLTLKLCAVSSMNDDGRACPIGRGLGISIQTGDAFLATVDVAVAGPAPPTSFGSSLVWQWRQEAFCHPYVQLQQDGGSAISLRTTQAAR
ncbi:Protein N-terminal asparagine amidohydrolase [Fragilaria crotonensis]|nr:Protein N-terminal asparagine amidohydrolase [Fragilaria crotonensis]